MHGASGPIVSPARENTCTFRSSHAQLGEFSTTKSCPCAYITARPQRLKNRTQGRRYICPRGKSWVIVEHYTPQTRNASVLTCQATRETHRRPQKQQQKMQSITSASNTAKPASYSVHDVSDFTQATWAGQGRTGGGDASGPTARGPNSGDRPWRRHHRQLCNTRLNASTYFSSGAGDVHVRIYRVPMLCFPTTPSQASLNLTSHTTRDHWTSCKSCHSRKRRATRWTCRRPTPREVPPLPPPPVPAEPHPLALAKVHAETAHRATLTNVVTTIHQCLDERDPDRDDYYVWQDEKEYGPPAPRQAARPDVRRQEPRTGSEPWAPSRPPPRAPPRSKPRPTETWSPEPAPSEAGSTEPTVPSEPTGSSEPAGPSRAPSSWARHALAIKS